MRLVPGLQIGSSLRAMHSLYPVLDRVATCSDTVGLWTAAARAPYGLNAVGPAGHEALPRERTRRRRRVGLRGVAAAARYIGDGRCAPISLGRRD